MSAITTNQNELIEAQRASKTQDRVLQAEKKARLANAKLVKAQECIRRMQEVDKDEENRLIAGARARKIADRLPTQPFIFDLAAGLQQVVYSKMKGIL